MFKCRGEAGSVLITSFVLLTLIVFSREAFGVGNEPCEYSESFPNAVCRPCQKEQWLELVLPPPSGTSEQITDPKKECFNSDPVTRSEYYVDYTVGRKVELVSKGPYIRNPSLHYHGFTIRKSSFLRYAYSRPPGPPIPYYDLDKVKKYYTRSGGNGPPQDADFQLLEWPGKGAADLKQSIEKDKNDKRPDSCLTDPKMRDTEQCKPYKYWMLEFDRENGKLLPYPCNQQEGTEIMAAAYHLGVTDTDREKINPFLESEQKIWLASGTHSMYRSYIEPLYVPERYLLKMGHTETSTKNKKYVCGLDQPDCLGSPSNSEVCIQRCRIFMEKGYHFSRSKGQSLQDADCYFRAPSNTSNITNVRREKPGTGVLGDSTFGDLRTVLDFTFSKNRLILAMRCGILIVDKILTDQLEFRVSVLKSEEGDMQKYPYLSNPVTRISSSTCCSKKCSKGSDLVAAYASHPYQWTDDHKFMYISFNRGDTFEKRIISSPYSPVNLIKGLYTLYTQWVDYYEILDTPSSDDLEEDDDFMRNLRKKDEWRYYSIDEKEELFEKGSSEPNLTKYTKIKEILEKRVPIRHARLNHDGERNIDKTPAWANSLINKRRKEAGWQDNWSDDNCSTIPECTEKFEMDKSIEWLFNGSIQVWTPKRDINEPYCGEITSIVTIPEGKRVMALCEVLYGNRDPPASPPPGSKPAYLRTHGHFAIYSFPIKQNIPLIYGVRVSKRIFKCNFIHNKIAQPEQIIPPVLVRILQTATFMVLNCKEVGFISNDFGKTIFNIAYYYERDVIENYCQQSPDYKPSPPIAEGCVNSLVDVPPGADLKQYVRSYRLCALDTPLFVQSDSHGIRFLITFGRFYLRGRIGYNSEARLFVGQTFNSDSTTGLLPEFVWENRFRNLVFPSNDIDGELILTVALVNTYSIAENGYFRQLYTDKKRHSLRLLPIPLQPYISNRHFYDDNVSVCKAAKLKGYAFEICQTNAFSAQPTYLSLDIGERGIIEVEVKDTNPFLPLFMFSSNEKSLDVSTTYGGQTQNLNLHTWTVHLQAVANEKDKENKEKYIDAFYGSDYNTLNEYSAELTLANTPRARCHTQPSAAIDVNIGCKGKRLIAHEDAYRPQCKEFQKNFKYRLPKDSFDPDLAKFLAYTESGDKNPFIKFIKGDLEITYDYTSWGCPIEPVATDLFIPDLRIVDETNYNDSAKAERFTGNFVLIELFGATGFNYELKVNGDICTKKPKRLKDYIQEWKERQRIFSLATNRLKFPIDVPDGLWTAEDVSGNPIFFNKAVLQYLNILNQGNYQSCNDSNILEPLSEKDKEEEYELMRTRPRKHIEGLAQEEGQDIGSLFEDDEDEIKENKLNKIRWAKDHQRVYLFLAISVDDETSVCNFYTIFGVSLDIISEMDDLESFLFFFFFVLIWILLVVGGYHIRKSYVRIAYIKKARTKKLEEAAWKVVYQYEKLLYENDMSLQNEDPPDTETGAGAAPAAAPVSSENQQRGKAPEKVRRERIQKLTAKK
ncbi:unnamed protein product [Orchesella dallaii]|uniref:Uncharacterized protein n=1 Tax=Orchesella dallaii TaxID=48710 RepID=A0ABP1R2S3_9HEXA